MLTLTPIEKVQADMASLGQRVEDLEKQISSTQKTIADAQAKLADAALSDKDLTVALRKVADKKAALSELQTMRDAMIQRLDMFQGEMHVARVEQAEQAVKKSQGEYEQLMIDLIAALESTWTKACALADLKAKVDRAIVFTDVPNPVRPPAFVGDLNPERFAHFSLRDIEQRFPDLFQRSGCVDDSHRTDRYRFERF